MRGDGYLIEVRRYCAGKHVATEYVARHGRKFFRKDEMILPGELFRTMEEAELVRFLLPEKRFKIRPGETVVTKVVPAWTGERSGN